MEKIITDLIQLETLVAGDNITFFVKDTELPRNQGSRELPKITYSIPLRSSYCWKDDYKDKSFFILAREADERIILAEIVPKEWFKLEQERGLIIEEPPRVNYEETLHRRCSYDIDDGWEWRLLCRAIHGKAPEPKEVDEFRNGQLYLNFFKTTPLIESITKGISATV